MVYQLLVGLTPGGFEAQKERLPDLSCPEGSDK